MKYGEAFHERSVPRWSLYNIDYNELKQFIKENTTRQSGQALTVPGQTDPQAAIFERQFYDLLHSQHDRVDLFVKSKADELSRRLRDYQKKTIHILSKCNLERKKKIGPRRRERFSRLEAKTLECGRDITDLERFVEAQKEALRKILKKYKKQTGSTSLVPKFTEEILGPKSFTRFNFEPLKNQYNVILTLIREVTPPTSAASTPTTVSRQQSRQDLQRQQRVIQLPQQSYWNEYEHGSEAGDVNEPYTIFLDPDHETSFPGAKTVVYVFTRLSSGANSVQEKVKGWLSPHSSSNERRPLIANGNSDYFGHNPNYVLGTDTEFDDDASSSDFPGGYETYYATFPSVKDQRLAQHKEKLLFQSTIGCFIAAILLLFIASILVATGRHRLRVEVDAGVFVGVFASLLFATMGFTTMTYRYSRIGWLQRSIVTVSFLAICVLSGVLLVLVMGNTNL